MQRRNKFIVDLTISIAVCAVWLWLLKILAEYTIDNPAILNLVWLFALAIGGGIGVSMVPGFIWGVLSTEDEITGEEE